MKMSELHSDMTRVLQIYADQYGHAMGVAIQDTPSLRDQFAMAALTGLMAISPAKQSLEGIAEFSYIAADAMLKAREAK
jgi:hypothetical protein